MERSRTFFVLALGIVIGGGLMGTLARAGGAAAQSSASDQQLKRIADSLERMERNGVTVKMDSSNNNVKLSGTITVEPPSFGFRIRND